MLSLKSTTEHTIEALCRAAKGPVGVAVSGGGDSLALLYMASDWARRTGRTLYGLTVDHGLRAGAAAEAREVGRHCKALGWPHMTLQWTPPQSGVSQAHSRRARHALLAGAMRKLSGTHLLMGHTLDDQIETGVMREARPGEGSVAGRAGMRALAVSPVWPEGRGVFVARPFLEVSREALREDLRARGLTWVDDPSNQNEMFERVRVRKALVADAVMLTEDMAAAKAKRCVQDSALVTWLDGHVLAREDGLIWCVPGELSVDALAEGLAWLIMVAAGSDRRADRTGRLALAEDILNTPGQWRARTLGGAWIGPRQGRIHIARDPGAVPGSDALEEGIWDGRFDLAGADIDPGLVLGENTMDDRLQAIPAMARPGWPVFVGQSSRVHCLVPQRLLDIRSMLDYESLMAGVLK